MKKLFYILLIVICSTSCNSHTPDVMIVNIADTISLPGIASDKTLHFSGNNLYYESMDEPGKETFKCFSLRDRKLLWSKSISTTGINQGAVTSEGEYVVPTLSDTVYLIDSLGNSRILRLQDRCKISPLVYGNTFVLQDRGIGLKCFDAKTLQEQWTIKQNSGFTMSQPLLLGDQLIYVLDDKSIRSSNASSGKLKWEVPIKDTLSIHDLYGHFGKIIFILSTALNGEKHIAAIDYRNGQQIWQVKTDSTINELERDMYGRSDILYCRGDSSLVMLNAKDGSKAGRYNLPSRITTNIIKDRNENLLFALDNNVLVQIALSGKVFYSKPFTRKLNRLYENDQNAYLYSYPELYLLDALPKHYE